ncbi:MAG: hypothetical protein KF729_27420 [Sandaracinaceae bacterium]|nr:hypothetical protein [Sandaracinaceae bacterium]
MRAQSFAVLLLASAASSASAQGRWDAVPDEAVEQTSEHYAETNERAHALFFPSIAGRGGAYLGVGSDQSLTLAAVQGAELVVLVDYDPVVTRLHRALAVLVAGCPDAACLEARLAPEEEARTAAAVARALGDDWHARSAVRELRVHRPLLARSVRAQRSTQSWLGRADWYAHVHRLAQRGRIVARVADLRGPSTLRAVAAAARAEGARFSVIYLSNAEEYFAYEPRFVDNLAALPHPPDAVVLRTLRDRRLPRAPADSMWHYDVQPLGDLLSRIRDHGYADSSWIVHDLLRSEVAHRPDGSSVLDARTRAYATPSSRRWWLEHAPPPPPALRGPRGPSRLLAVTRRAVSPALDAARRARLERVELAGTEVAHLRDVVLPPDPRTGRAVELSGEPAPGALPRVPEPEDNLHAMLLDGVAREVLPALYARAGEDAIAASLRDAPAAADRYAAYRMRERLLERCPARARPARGASPEALAATRACRHATRLIRPVPTARARPGWPEREAAIGRAMHAIGREAAASDAAADALVVLFERLARVAAATGGE